MGGMGSMWGTLLGGVVLGVSQTVGTQAFGAGWGLVRRPRRVPHGPRRPPSGFFAKTVTA